MIVKLVRHTFPDRPDWFLIEETVPIGTMYEVLGYDREFIVINEELKEARPVGAFLLSNVDGVGWLPCVCFERVEYVQQERSKSSTSLQEN